MFDKVFIYLVLSFSFLHSYSGDYWLVDDYYKTYPKQEENSIKFKELVRQNSKPIASQNEKVNISIVYPGVQISDYWRRSKSSFEKRLKELNINYKLQDHFTKPATLREQALYLTKAIKDDTDYLIFTMDAKRHSKFIETIISKNKPKLILQNITTPLKKWGEVQPFLYVGFDHKIGSLKIADYYINKTKGEGKYAVLYGTQGYVSAMRGDEFIKYINKNSKLELVDAYYTGFNKQKAYKATKEILKRDKDLKFIYACSTDIAHGVIKALKELNLQNKIMVNGWGGGSSELQAISDKAMELTIMRINDDNGIAMAEAIKLDLEKKGKSVPLIFSGDMVIVKKGISKDDLLELEKKAFRYSN